MAKYAPNPRFSKVAILPFCISSNISQADMTWNGFINRYSTSWYIPRMDQLYYVLFSSNYPIH